MTDRTPTLEELTRLMRQFVDTATKAMDAANKLNKANAAPYDNIAKAMLEQLEHSSEERIPGRRAYNSFKEYREAVHTAAHWDDSQWSEKWLEIYKSRARAGILTTYQTMILSVLTDPTIQAAEMRNLIAVLALLPAEKVLPFYNFLMYEKMGLEATDALEHMDTIPVPMHNPRILADLNSKTLQEYKAWQATPYVYEGCGAPQQPFSLYAENASFSGTYRRAGVFDRAVQVTQCMTRDLVGAGATDVPLVKPARLTVHITGESKNAPRASNQKLAQDK